MTDGHIIAVTGTRAEAALLPPHWTIITGNDPQQLQTALQDAAAGAAGVISFGLATGLDPALPGGTMVTATRLRGRNGVAYAADSAWAAKLARHCRARMGVLAGAEDMPTDPTTKRALQAATGALAADPASLVAAAFAAQHRLPFAVLRALADTAEDTVPPEAPLLLTLLRRPAAFKPALQQRQRIRMALKILASVARDLPQPR